MHQDPCSLTFKHLKCDGYPPRIEFSYLQHQISVGMGYHQMKLGGSMALIVMLFMKLVAGDLKPLWLFIMKLGK